jgi:hypothetical protein
MNRIALGILIGAGVGLAFEHKRQQAAAAAPVRRRANPETQELHPVAALLLQEGTTAMSAYIRAKMEPAPAPSAPTPAQPTITMTFQNGRWVSV